MYSLTVQETEVQNEGVSWIGSLLGVHRENLFQAFLFVSGGVRNPWHSLTCRHITPVSASVLHGALPL